MAPGSASPQTQTETCLRPEERTEEEEENKEDKKKRKVVKVIRIFEAELSSCELGH